MVSKSDLVGAGLAVSAVEVDTRGFDVVVVTVLVVVVTVRVETAGGSGGVEQAANAVRLAARSKLAGFDDDFIVQVLMMCFRLFVRIELTANRYGIL